MITLFKDRTRKSYVVSTSKRELRDDALKRFKNKKFVILNCWLRDDLLFLEKPETFDEKAFVCFSLRGGKKKCKNQ